MINLPGTPNILCTHHNIAHLLPKFLTQIIQLKGLIYSWADNLELGRT